MVCNLFVIYRSKITNSIKNFGFMPEFFVCVAENIEKQDIPPPYSPAANPRPQTGVAFSQKMTKGGLCEPKKLSALSKERRVLY